jgi:hypothetical protein
VIDSPGPYERMRRQVVRGVAWLMLIAAVVTGVIALGRWSLGQLKGDRFQVAFEDIDCEAPPGMSRADFLGEVHYLSRLPAKIPVTDAETQATLRAAFERHPWVLGVEEIEPRPPNQLRVRLSFRTPALAVPWDGGVRVVDDRGVLLPRKASAEGLPIFSGNAKAPYDEGKIWPDADVVREAARR